MTTTTSANPDELPRLRADINGRVIGPDDADYDAARTVMLGGVDRRPAAIVRVADTDDVRAVIALARETGLELAVRSGGHSARGPQHGRGRHRARPARPQRPRDRREARTAWAGQRPDRGRVLQGRGRARPRDRVRRHRLGRASAGITTGGGIGYLVRKHGLTIDNLLAAEIVTADGELARVDATTTRTCSGRSAGAAATSAS